MALFWFCSLAQNESSSEYTYHIATKQSSNNNFTSVNIEINFEKILKLKIFITRIFVNSQAVNAKSVPEDDIGLEIFNLQLENEKGPTLTPEQQKCIQANILKVVNDNPQLNWWWEEIAKSGQKLEEAAQKCAALPNQADQK